MDAMRDCGKPVVGHNLSFDLSYTLHSCAAELPDTWAEYKALVARWFPGGVYDTKHLAAQLRLQQWQQQQQQDADMEVDGAEEAGAGGEATATTVPLFEDTSLGSVHDGLLKGQVGGCIADEGCQWPSKCSLCALGDTL